MVIGYHFFPDIFPVGYLGVDVFFVISGFVITRMIVNWRDVSTTEFLKRFYARRIKRLALSLFVCVAVTAVLFVLLTSRPSKEMFATGGYALIGLANINMFIQPADYFSLDAKLNAFTHMWSLGVEEQFYLIFPFLALYLKAPTGSESGIARHAGKALLLVVGVSFAAVLFFAEDDRMAVFYLLPFGAWELVAGALVFVYARHGIALSGKLAGGVGLCFLAAILIDFKSEILQQFSAVALSAFILLHISGGAQSLLKSTLENSVLAYIGKRSYSLYLYHWPFYVLSAVTVGHSLGGLSIRLR